MGIQEDYQKTTKGLGALFIIALVMLVIFVFASSYCRGTEPVESSSLPVEKSGDLHRAHRCSEMLRMLPC